MHDLDPICLTAASRMIGRGRIAIKVEQLGGGALPLEIVFLGGRRDCAQGRPGRMSLTPCDNAPPEHPHGHRAPLALALTARDCVRAAHP